MTTTQKICFKFFIIISFVLRLATPVCAGTKSEHTGTKLPIILQIKLVLIPEYLKLIPESVIRQICLHPDRHFTHRVHEFQCTGVQTDASLETPPRVPIFVVAHDWTPHTRQLDPDLVSPPRDGTDFQ